MILFFFLIVKHKSQSAKKHKRTKKQQNNEKQTAKKQLGAAARTVSARIMDVLERARATRLRAKAEYDDRQATRCCQLGVS